MKNFVVFCAALGWLICGDLNGVAAFIITGEAIVGIGTIIAKKLTIKS